MASAEADRADLTASETATLVELFLLRHVVQLRSNERRGFENVWVVDSLGAIAESQRPGAGTDGNQHGPDSAVAAIVRRVVQGQTTESGRAPNVIVDDLARPRRLVFIEPANSSGLSRFIVATSALDSLGTWLRGSPRASAFDIVIRSGTDTILSLVASNRARKSRTIDRAIATPFSSPWTLTMSYAPAGRGVRIALWIVGLGAIVGLGIGLLLERREASRIADRSSELEHLSAELLRANRAKSEFLANVSHELRTPLNAIVGFVDLLRDGVYGALNSRQVGPVERIEASANHLRHLVDQILDLAKMAAGRLEVHAEPIELRPFVFDVASEVEPLITEKGLSFSLAVGATLPRVRTDPTHLRQILINLLGNAVKFTSHGTVTVRGKLLGADDGTTGLLSPRFTPTTSHAKPPRSAGVWIALQVVDSGVGIPAKDCDRIFDEFEQVNAGPRGDSMRRGTGLGLSISRRLARLLGGDITVESELGRGSIFTVWLPVDPADLRGGKAA